MSMLQVEAATDEAQSADSVMKPPQPITISLVRPAALPVDVTLMPRTRVTSWYTTRAARLVAVGHAAVFGGGTPRVCWEAPEASHQLGSPSGTKLQ